MTQDPSRIEGERKKKREMSAKKLKRKKKKLQNKKELLPKAGWFVFLLVFIFYLWNTGLITGFSKSVLLKRKK